MRLSDTERDAITTAVARHFGTDARVFLFGSRTDDLRRGGDIDLLVETGLPESVALRAKIATISDIQLAIGDQKIDLVTCEHRSSPAEEQPLIIVNARRQGVPL
jgi:predicted nucleotidyltransferase